MNTSPIFVAARTARDAEGFVCNDLKEDLHRLRYVSSEDVLRGIAPNTLVYVIPGATEHREYSRIMLMLRARGMLVATVSDYYARCFYENRSK